MSKRAVPARRGERVALRLLQEDDLPLTLAWRNQDHIRRWFFNSDVVVAEQHRAWFEKYRLRDDDFVFIFEEVRSPGRPVGQVSLYNVEWEAKRAEYGRLMIGDPEAAGRGLAREATQLLLGTAFDVLGLEQVHLEVYANNERAVAVYHACGFEVAQRRGDVLFMTRARRD